MAARSRFQSFVATLVTAVALAVLMVIAVEYWRIWKDPMQPGTIRDSGVQQAVAPLAPRPSISPSFGTSGASAATVTDDGLRPQLEAAAEALGQANQRVRQLGEERDALLAERDELLQIRAALASRVSAAEQAAGAQAGEASGLVQQLDEQSGEIEQLRKGLASASEDLAALVRERDGLRAELQGARQRIAALSSARPASTAAAASPLSNPSSVSTPSSAATTPSTPAGSSTRPAASATGGRGERVLDLSRLRAGGSSAQESQAHRSASANAQDAAGIPGEEPEVTSEAGVKAYNAGDYDKAARIWRELAQAGSPRAQFHLGSLLFEGRVGEADLVQAYIWLSRSVSRGFGPALAMRERVRAMMSAAELGRAREQLG